MSKNTGDNEVFTVDTQTRLAADMAVEPPNKEQLAALANDKPLVNVIDLNAGYGRMEILHGFNLQLAAGQSVCLIGPNGAGKSTVLHSIYGFTNITSGSVMVDDQNITRLSPNQKLQQAKIAYILQDNSVFTEMTVEENLWMGGYLLNDNKAAKLAADKIFDKYPRLAARRSQRAGVLSGGERRLLEISRALVTEPQVLLVDEPSIGLEPKYIDMVFEILTDLQQRDGKTIIMVEQNAKKGLEFADLGYVLVSGQLAMVDSGKNLLQNPDVGRLFLGG